MKKKIIIGVSCIVIVIIALLAFFFIWRGRQTDISSETAAVQETGNDAGTDDEVRETEPAEETEPVEEPAQTETEDEVASGSSQDDAVWLPLGTKVYGTVPADQYAWFSFTTGSEAGAVYNITAINGTPDGKDLQFRLYNEYGERLDYNVARPDGVPGTICADYLESDTVYYVSLSAALPGTVDFSLQVRNPDAENTAYNTIGTFREAAGTSVENDGTAAAGTSPNNAVMIPFETKIEGMVMQGDYAWFEFLTGEDADAEYKISIVNKDQKKDLQAYFYDEYGNRLDYTGVRAGGRTETISESGLKPETSYYIRLNPALTGDLEYSLIVRTSEEKKQENTLIFETPFEINETQVQFVSNKAEFLDEEKAKEVLKPVAEAILNAPDHAIMIAGTTATYGDQASSVTLSGERAEAVKQLLTAVYNVPESQIGTVGLGYELDPFERGQDVDANGNFVESEGVKNRRVVVLDMDDPIAQELMAYK